MKIIGIIITIIVGWAVRLTCGWIATRFGTPVDPAEQATAINLITGSILAALIAAVELFERLVWPRIKGRLVAWFDKKFPPKW